MRGTLRDSASAGIGGAQVVARGPHDSLAASLLTDSSGAWSAGTLTEGTYHVQFYLPDGSNQWAYGKADEAAAAAIVVTDGGTATVDDTFLDSRRVAHLRGTSPTLRRTPASPAPASS